MPLPAAEILLTFALGGGAPPPASEMLRIHRDGTAVALAGNTWPAGPLDEVGFFQTALEPAALRELEGFLSGHRFKSAELGPIAADSGFAVLWLYRDGSETKIKWSPFAEIPEFLAELQGRLRKILDDVRRHPAQTVRAGWTVPAEVRAGQPFDVEVRLTNRGTQAVRLLPQPSSPLPLRIQLLAEPASAAAAPSPEAYPQAQPAVSLKAPDLAGGELASKEAFVVQATASLQLEPGRYLLQGFLDLQLEGAFDGKALPLDCLILLPSRELNVR